MINTDKKFLHNNINFNNIEKLRKNNQYNDYGTFNIKLNLSKKKIYPKEKYTIKEKNIQKTN